ncbi:hypothetical protein HBH98_024710 [Parastagonospora nodorum]|nr:hypothetical protein HBH53_077240 [Parastagonospora nodorum]KAH3986922.1 hypothetical protein HBH51_010310 [Parastagonospora nodorum]KAH4042110.1 hypothetical protein HBI09_008900 [Parastagonospora nodorum]KAH4235204.1 hypothetical protein HBI06_057100 [Parastagonospora nodorum]KAH4249732.1 hypothetical protein HBI05_009320 [Parastagonospora nodorum]
MEHGTGPRIDRRPYCGAGRYDLGTVQPPTIRRTWQLRNENNLFRHMDFAFPVTDGYEAMPFDKDVDHSQFIER